MKKYRKTLSYFFIGSQSQYYPAGAPMNFKEFTLPYGSTMHGEFFIGSQSQGYQFEAPALSYPQHTSILSDEQVGEPSATVLKPSEMLSPLKSVGTISTFDQPSTSSHFMSSSKPTETITSQSDDDNCDEQN